MTLTPFPTRTPASVPLWDRARRHVIGSVVRTKPRTNPLFVSPGHKISVESATRLTLACLRGYRLPEPTRQAHNLITAYKKTGTLPSPPNSRTRRRCRFEYDMRCPAGTLPPLRGIGYPRQENIEHIANRQSWCPPVA